MSPEQSLPYLRNHLSFFLVFTFQFFFLNQTRLHKRSRTTKVYTLLTSTEIFKRLYVDDMCPPEFFAARNNFYWVGGE